MIGAEWRLFLASRANIAILAALALITLVALQFGATRVSETRVAQAEAVTAAQQSWAKKIEDFVAVAEGRQSVSEYFDPRRADYAILVYRQPLPLPPPPLALLSAGNAKEGHGIIEVGMASMMRSGAESRENPDNRIDGPLDMAFITAWLLPLIIILLSHDILSADRETGRARLLASQARSLAAIVTVRAAVRGLPLFVMLGLLVTLATLWVNRTLPILPTLSDLALWLTGLALAIIFWSGFAALVNARAQTSAKAVAILLGGWLFFALLLPALAAAAMAATAPPPDRLATLIGMRAAESDLTERAGEVTEAYYRANPLRRPARGPINEYEGYFVGEYYPRQIAIDQLFAPVLARQANARIAQAQALRWWSLASPALAMATLTEDLAGHAPERSEGHFAKARALQARWRAHFDVILAARIPLRLEDYRRAPIADSSGLTASTPLRALLFPLLGMLALALIVGGIARHQLRRAVP